MPIQIIIFLIKHRILPGLDDTVEGDYEQTSPQSSNNWHHVTISRKIGSKNSFTWKNMAGVEWDLTFLGVESGGVLKFEVGEDCPYYDTGYTEARLFIQNNIEIEGPGGRFTKKIGDDNNLCPGVYTAHILTSTSKFKPSTGNQTVLGKFNLYRCC